MNLRNAKHPQPEPARIDAWDDGRVDVALKIIIPIHGPGLVGH